MIVPAFWIKSTPGPSQNPRFLTDSAKGIQECIRSCVIKKLTRPDVVGISSIRFLRAAEQSSTTARFEKPFCVHRVSCMFAHQNGSLGFDPFRRNHDSRILSIPNSADDLLVVSTLAISLQCVCKSEFVHLHRSA